MRCHLLPRKLLRQELPYGLILEGGRWRRAEHPARELGEGQRWSLASLLRDERLMVPGCGGVTGAGGHHGMLDHERRLKIPRDAIPERSRFELLVAQIGLTWWLEREYGQREGG